MKMPNIDLKKLERIKRQNFEERLESIKLYAEWLKKSSNKKWSSQQKNIIG